MHIILLNSYSYSVFLSFWFVYLCTCVRRTTIILSIIACRCLYARIYHTISCSYKRYVFHLCTYVIRHGYISMKAGEDDNSIKHSNCRQQNEFMYLALESRIWENDESNRKVWRAFLHSNICLTLDAMTQRIVNVSWNKPGGRRVAHWILAFKLCQYVINHHRWKSFSILMLVSDL